MGFMRDFSTKQNEQESSAYQLLVGGYSVIHVPLKREFLTYGQTQRVLLVTLYIITRFL